MVYDSRDGYVLLFGGYTRGGDLKDTWKYAGGRWTDLHPATSPVATAGASMAFDAADNYVVLFGGESGSTALSTTWKWAAGVWTKLAPATHPTARVSAAMGYDAKDGYVVLFGGVSQASVAQSDTWKFVGGAWTKLTESVHPSGRWFSSMAYDPASSELVLFGGANTSILGDTWNFSGGHWTNLTAAVGPGPTPRYADALAYSAKDSELVLFGGETGSGFVSDTWTFSGTNWTKISTYVHPSSRGGAMVADGAVGGTVILFGGESSLGTGLNDTWTFHGLVWSHPVPPQPAPRSGAAMTYDEADGYVLMFGGWAKGAVANLGDTWKFVGGVWTQLHPAISPAPRYAASMTYDQTDGYVVLFGGVNLNGTTFYGDTWTFSAGVWTQSTFSGGPPARAAAFMTFDAADGYVLLFGGANSMTNLNDTWAFEGGVWWEPLAVPGVSPAPQPLDAGEMAYDSEDGYVLLTGGFSTLGYPEYSTWTYSAGAWTNVTSIVGTGPPYPSYAGMVDDTYDGYLLYYGGYVGGDWSNQTWSYVGGTWTNLTSRVNPGLLAGMGMTFDPLDNSVVVFGGGAYGFVAQGTTWTY
jgi:Kelch motif/Galactose oxidase, central domain